MDTKGGEKTDLYKCSFTICLAVSDNVDIYGRRNRIIYKFKKGERSSCHFSF